MPHSADLNTVRRSRCLIEEIQLDLSDLVVYTEAATGGYSVTAGLAAMAGAERVFALAKNSRYGRAEEAAEDTLDFAGLAGVGDRLEVVYEKRLGDLGQADIVTNSGHVRPIDKEVVAALKGSAVIPLMYEAWEFRPQDLDLGACRMRGIAVAGTNESHPRMGILRYLGMMMLKLLLDGGFEVVDTRVALLTDNKFGFYAASALGMTGAEVRIACQEDLWEELRSQSGKISYMGDLKGLQNEVNKLEDLDAVILVMSPSREIWIGEAGKAVIHAEALAHFAPNGIIAQFWGNVDRGAIAAAGLKILPAQEPPLHHMGILPSDLGLLPVVKLQLGGLKVGELMSRSRRQGGTALEAVREACIKGWGQGLD